MIDLAHSRFSILKDVNGKPVPQYWNPKMNRYQVIESDNGKLRVTLINKDGSYAHTQELVDQINEQVNELVRVVENIGI